MRIGRCARRKKTKRGLDPVRVLDGGDRVTCERGAEVIDPHDVADGCFVAQVEPESRGLREELSGPRVVAHSRREREGVGDTAPRIVGCAGEQHRRACLRSSSSDVHGGHLRRERERGASKPSHRTKLGDAGVTERESRLRVECSVVEQAAEKRAFRGPCMRLHLRDLGAHDVLVGLRAFRRVEENAGHRDHATSERVRLGGVGASRVRLCSEPLVRGRERAREGVCHDVAVEIVESAVNRAKRDGEERIECDDERYVLPRQRQVRFAERRFVICSAVR